jgi:ATP:cob(I)alamin adenosyltransferase
MSKLPNITTKGGDKGHTGLFSGERVSKGSLVMETMSKLDSFDSYLGLLRHQGLPTAATEGIRAIQLLLVHFKGEIAVHPSKWSALPKHINPIAVEDVEALDTSSALFRKELESQDFTISGWTIYGDEGLATAHIDIARGLCREAEVKLHQLLNAYHSDLGTTTCIPNPHLAIFINRLSDWLFWLGRASRERK